MTGLTIKIVGTILVLGACVFAALLILDRFENPTSKFATYEEMEASGLMQAGWIPKILPRSAYEISETHNLDTSIVRISFRFVPGDTSVVEEKCRPASSDGTPGVFTCAGGILTLTRDGVGFFTDDKESQGL